MPQELHVVQCCTCEMFQVDIVKKVPKWSCKMCGEKQSLKKVFAKGTGKECRLFVQQLNQNNAEKESTSQSISQSIENTSIKMEFSSAYSSNHHSDMRSKWTEFTHDNDTAKEVSEIKFNSVEVESKLDPKEIRFSSSHPCNTTQRKKTKISFNCGNKEATVEMINEDVCEKVERTTVQPGVYLKESASSIFEDNDIDAINFD